MLSRTSLMFLWEIKNTIILQNLRELCVVLKSVHSIEHLWCFFENSKTPSFHKISANFVLLKQIQKIHTRWHRQAQLPIIPLHDAWACRRQHQKKLITSSPHHQEKFQTHSGFDKLSHQIFYYTVPEPPEGTTFLDLPQNIEPTTIKNRSPK